jgi:hypothetical protein
MATDFGRMWSWPNFMCYSSLWLEWYRKTTTKSSVVVAGALAKVRIGDIRLEHIYSVNYASYYRKVESDVTKKRAGIA